MTSVRIPNDWTPRPHQRPLYNQFGHGKLYQRASIVWHRRAGKDSTALNLTARDMFKRVGTYWHMFPEQTQARRAIWNGIDRQGRRIIDQAFPPGARLAGQEKSEQEMLIRLANGSTWQMAGSDNYDSLVGSNPVGVVFSEWALADPAAWDYIRPILVENGGWALFITTPRGRNHAYSTHQMAQHNDEWMAELLTVEDTGLVTPQQIQSERDAGYSEARIRQEFYCDFLADVDDTFIAPSLVRESMERSPRSWPEDELVLGVDVARFGDDKSVLKLRRGRDAATVPAVKLQGADTMQVAARVMETIDREKPDATFIDEGGVGGGVIDRCRQMGYEVMGVNFGAKADRMVQGAPKSANKRAEMWATLRQWLGEGGVLPDDRALEMELTSPTYSFDAQNRIVLEKKSDMKKRGLPSPDEADALALTFAYPVQARSIAQIQEDQRVEEYHPVWD